MGELQNRVKKVWFRRNVGFLCPWAGSPRGCPMLATNSTAGNSALANGGISGVEVKGWLKPRKGCLDTRCYSKMTNKIRSLSWALQLRLLNVSANVGLSMSVVMIGECARERIHLSRHFVTKQKNSGYLIGWLVLKLQLQHMYPHPLCIDLFAHEVSIEAPYTTSTLAYQQRVRRNHFLCNSQKHHRNSTLQDPGP